MNGLFCENKCAVGEHFNPETKVCEQCDAYWKKQEGKTCVNICPLDKSYNQYSNPESVFEG